MIGLLQREADIHGASGLSKTPSRMTPPPFNTREDYIVSPAKRCKQHSPPRHRKGCQLSSTASIGGLPLAIDGRRRRLSPVCYMLLRQPRDPSRAPATHALVLRHLRSTMHERMALQSLCSRIHSFGLDYKVLGGGPSAAEYGISTAA